MAYVGNVTAMKLKTLNPMSEEQETTITNQRLFVNPGATYEQVDSFARALANLSRNSYQDTLLITQVSVNEVLENQ